MSQIYFSSSKNGILSRIAVSFLRELYSLCFCYYYKTVDHCHWRWTDMKRVVSIDTAILEAVGAAVGGSNCHYFELLLTLLHRIAVGRNSDVHAYDF